MNYKIYWRNPDSKENHLVHASNALDPALHVLEPTLDQAVNSHGSLSFKVLPTNPEYGSIRKLMTVVTVHDGDDLIFRGRVIETTQDIDGIVSVYCEGELAFLCDSVHTPFVYGGSTATPGDLFRRLIANHNAYTTSIDNSNREKLFTVGQVTIPARKGYTYSADTARSTWDLLIDGLINQLGGYLRTRHADDGTTYIDYLADYTGTAQQTVEYGKNLLSLEDGIVGGDIITVLLPYGGKPEGVDARTTIESVNNGKSYIKADAETIAKYRNIWGTQTWDEITDPGQLLQAAQSYLNAQKEALNTVSAEALERVTVYFAEVLADAADEVPRDETGVCQLDRKAVLAGAASAYDGIYEEFPFLRMETGGVKPFGCSSALSVLRFTGFYFPFTGEANVNMDSPSAYLPATVCHEMAHQRGIISEQECNFVGILAATRSDDPAYRYAGWLEGYVYLSNALYRSDPERCLAIRETLPEEVRADLRADSAYWARFRGPVSQVSETVYDVFLKTNGDENGVRSYGMVTDLLVTYFDG